MKHFREEEVSLSLSLSLGIGGSAGEHKKLRRSPARDGEGEFVCKTCSRAFASFQALGGHRTSHMRGRHGLALGQGPEQAKARKEGKASHECHICGLGFEIGQALGGHMRRHRDELALAAAHQPPILLELFV